MGGHHSILDEQCPPSRIATAAGQRNVLGDESPYLRSIATGTKRREQGTWRSGQIGNRPEEQARRLFFQSRCCQPAGGVCGTTQFWAAVLLVKDGGEGGATQRNRVQQYSPSATAACRCEG